VGHLEPGDHQALLGIKDHREEMELMELPVHKGKRESQGTQQATTILSGLRGWS